MDRGLFAIRPIILLLALAPTASSQTPSYGAEYLGTATGIAAMNDGGELVGSTNVGPNLRAWIARSGSPVTPLPLPPGRISSSASDINELGAVSGAVSSSSSPEFGGIAAIWLPDTSGGYTVVELGTLPGHVRSEATALNNVGDIVGFSMSGMFRYPVSFQVGAPPQDLSATGIFDPRSINDQRVLVDGSFTAKRLDLNTMIVEDLGVPTGLPTSYLATSAAVINASNQVAGSAILATSTNCDRQAARYTDGVGWEIFSFCGPYNGASDMNDQGDVVMRIGLAPHVRFEGLGIYAVEDLIVPSVGHWYPFTGSSGSINNLRQMGITAQNPTTGESGILLLTPIGGPAVVYCAGDGSASACPCGNVGAPAHGCANGSFTSGCALTSTGNAGVGADMLVLAAASSTPGQPGLFFQGDNAINGGDGVQFGDGLRCAGGGVVRLEVVTADGSGSASSSIPIASTGGVTPGDTKYYQWWYRNPGTSLCGMNFNLSNAVLVTWAP